MRRWLAVALCLLAWPAQADMYPDASNAKFPGARENLGVGACDPVAEFGADPSGAADSTAAINQCLALFGHGQNVRLPVGNFKITGEIVLSNAQTLSGAGRGTTQLVMDHGFRDSGCRVYLLPAERPGQPGRVSPVGDVQQFCRRQRLQVPAGYFDERGAVQGAEHPYQQGLEGHRQHIGGLA